MTMQSNGQVATTKKSKRVVKRRGNGKVPDAELDVDVIRMVSGEVDKRVANLHSKIADAAYFRALKRGFVPGHELDDWLAAEAEIMHGAHP